MSLRQHRAIGITLVIVTSLSAAYANSPEPDRTIIAAAVQTCTAEGAFGYRFGEKDARPRDSGLAPFAIEGLAAQREGVFEIAAAAWFGKAPMSGEDRAALTAWVYHALETQITARRHFVKRAPRPDGVTYFSESDPTRGFALDLSHDGLRVRLVCTDNARKKRGWKSVRGVDPESGQTLEGESAKMPPAAVP